MRSLLTDPAGAADARRPAADPGTLEGLAAVYAYPDAADRGVGTPWLRANMVASLDGAARWDGHSEGLSGTADKRVFGVLRALSDVVLVGAETVRSEGYRPARAREAFAAARAARGQAPAPAVAVVSRNLDLDFSAPLFTGPLVRTVVVTAEAAPAGARRAAAEVADVVVAGGEQVDMAAAVRALADRGWTRLLTEGGPRLLGQLAAAGLLDELCLSLAPLVVAGDAPRIMHGPQLAAAQRMELRSLLEEDGFLFARYARAGR
ncbi:pyrimidine reductase family protein [Streptacidiphilus sp. ASG 303]|uniref:pyrimidine reductase family protein n=1 Tax=Streptacidiphilus sp. ASG 303 TaxID=2896847 RepID=UPI001E30A01F|nr:pyrimidine reductase family protein [Streptacidiphilus sp. ASG 303]MCD0483088.1 pyrimidine reductase family protein [Streptacidiphilus sp. ASG 303]